ncbi:NAD-dependent protein deacetylase SRT1 [Porphyridium purpureum]|uniref:protein acetyllysine N-acetyltransferase n=1 Tax=Porphyridium purpureum TaxID=35688 RepID=A0A5J4Z2M7_PORPP|nr:NAD-dependent protein deacetylase SRT1 [Porphyridium purpureum]|eukprot:POR1927..scf208_2
MSDGYAARLSPGFKGQLNLTECREPHRALMLRKAAWLAEQIASAQSVVFHTGAGISTSSGIQDFRGPAGVWTLESRRKRKRVNAADLAKHEDEAVPVAEVTESMALALPTLTHMVLAKMVQQTPGKTRVISQNVDNLHVRSGLDFEHLREIHGNTVLEYCRYCGATYPRDFEIERVGVEVRGGSRRCDNPDCANINDPLHADVLDFNDPLNAEHLTFARQASKAADLCVVLGSSLQMLPSREFPQLCKRPKVAVGNQPSVRGQLAIINLSRTPKDHLADMVCRHETDEFMFHVARELGIDIDAHRRYLILYTQWTLDKLCVACDRRMSWFRVPYIRCATLVCGTTGVALDSPVCVTEDAQKPLCLKVGSSHAVQTMPKVMLRLDFFKRAHYVAEVLLDCSRMSTDVFTPAQALEQQSAHDCSQPVGHRILVAEKSFAAECEEYRSQCAGERVASRQTGEQDAKRRSASAVNHPFTFCVRVNEHPFRTWQCVLCHQKFHTNSRDLKLHHRQCLHIV